MAIVNNAFIRCNRQGIPCLESQGVSLTSTECTFTFKNHNFLNSDFMGFIAVKLAQSITAPSSAVPIVFSTLGTGARNTAMKVNNAEMTTADYAGPGVYLFFYDRSSNTLQLIA